MQGPEGGDEIKQPSEDHRGQVFFKQLWPSKGRPSGKGKWPQKEGYEHKKEWVETNPAWDEQVLVKEAWDEDVIDYYYCSKCGEKKNP